MPIELAAAIEQPAVVIAAKEISYFACDLVNMTVSVRFTYVDTAGKRHHERDEDYTLSLIKDGQPRFSGAEYSSIKSMLYRLALEDGAVSGTVV